MNHFQVSILGVFLCFVAIGLSYQYEYVKPGRCPPERFYTKKIESKATFCTHDSDCLGGKKCCDDNGSKFCKMPAKVRKGFCTTKVPKSGTYKPCDDKCSIDSDCAPGSKCCFKTCGRECTPSVGVKKGICKNENVVINCFIPQQLFCADDTACPNNEKCCRRGCGNDCEVPLQVLG